MVSHRGRFATFFSRNWLRLYLLLFAGGLIFAYGVAVGVFKLPPYKLLETLAAGARDWYRYPKHNARLVPERFLFPLREKGGSVLVHDPARAFQGHTFLTGFFGDSIGMRLIDMQGHVVHDWKVSLRSVWPDAKHLEKGTPHDWDSQIQGAVLYPNGDVIFNFLYSGLVRIDKCSRVKWQLPQQTHHSIFEDHEGNLWVPGRRLQREPMDRYPLVPAPFYEEYVLKITPEGKVLREISVLDPIFISSYEGVLFPNAAHRPELAIPPDYDFTHLNDAEVLTPELAPAFPQFAVGDLLISLRNLNLLMVVDPNTGQIKWARTGPYLRQHDPDFRPNGRITVFDNRRDPSGGGTFGGSRILEIDPGTGEVVTLFGQGRGPHFYTEIMGDHEWLPNGNLLITESKPGRILEVAPDGEVVWSYINQWDEHHAAQVERALRYPAGYWAPNEQESCS